MLNVYSLFKIKKTSLDLGIIPELLKLMKPRVMSLVIFTCAVGLLTAPNSISFTIILGILIVAVGAGAAGALNMWYEADVDETINRTCHETAAKGKFKKTGFIFWNNFINCQ